MNETEYAKLNIIEGSDKVNYAILNDNTRKIEDELMRKSIRNTVTGTTAAVTATGPWYSVTNSTAEDISVTINGEAIPVAAESTVKVDIENIENDFEISLSSETDVTLTYFVTVKSYVDSHGGGGGGGTSNYNDLSNRPSINNVTLAGNKTAADLGLVAAETGKGLSTNDFTAAYKKQLDDLPGTLEDKADSADIGAANGIASLGSDGKVPSSQLPAPVAQKEFKLVSVSSESYAAAYKLQVKDGETWSDISGSATINIPKDMVVESGSVKECTADNVPVSGYKKGDKYIDLVIANKANAHIYINVKDLIDNKADGIQYSNTTSKLAATNVQSAIDEIVEMLKDKADETELLSTIVASSNASANNSKTLEFQGTGKALEKLVIEGKTVQDGTPSPSSPIEVKGVGDGGWNILHKPIPQTKALNGITISVDDNGMYHIVGQATANTTILFDIGDTVFPTSISNGGTGCIYIGNLISTSDVSLVLYKDDTKLDTYTLSGLNRLSPGYNTLQGKTVNKIGFSVNSGYKLDTVVSPMLTSNGRSNNTFVPYGKYKIPISVAGKSTNIYLDAPLYDGDKADLVSGVTDKKYGMVCFDDITLTYRQTNSAGYSTFSFDIPKRKPNITGKLYSDALKGLPEVTAYTDMLSLNEECICLYKGLQTTSTTVYVNLYNKTNAESASEALKGHYIVYPLATDTKESFEAPEIATSVGKNTLTVGTDVTPTKVEVTSFGEYYSKAEVDKLITKSFEYYDEHVVVDITEDLQTAFKITSGTITYIKERGIKKVILNQVTVSESNMSVPASSDFISLLKPETNIAHYGAITSPTTNSLGNIIIGGTGNIALRMPSAGVYSGEIVYS